MSIKCHAVLPALVYKDVIRRKKNVPSVDVTKTGVITLPSDVQIK